MPRGGKRPARRRIRFRGAAALAAVLSVSAACSGVSNSNTSANTQAPPFAPRAVLVAQPIVFVPSAIDYTGKTDVTNKLQSFIDNVDNGSLVRFHKNGRYRVEGTLFVTNKTDLTFDGQNATIFATIPGTLERSQWWITGGGGIVFRNMIVHGANPHAGLADNAYDPKREKQHGFRIEGVEGIELGKVSVTDVYGDFAYVARFVEAPSTNVWIHDCTFARNGRQGISIIAATGVIIERNTFIDTRRGTIDLEPNGPNQTVSSVFLLNNTIGVGRLFFIASHGKGPVNDIVVTGNHLHKHLMTIDVVPPAGERRRNWIVTNNTSDITANTRPIRWINTDGVLVSGNTQKVVATQPSIELTDVCGAKITNNSFGTKLLSQHGPTCSATIVVPTPPAIPGRH